MRIMIVPNLGFGAVEGESNYLLYYNFVRLWLEEGFRCRVLFLVPFEFKGRLAELENVSWIYEREGIKFATNAGLFSGSMYSMLHPAYSVTPVDCVVMNRPIIAGSLAAFLYNRRINEAETVIVNHDSVAGLMCEGTVDIGKFTPLKLMSYVLLPSVYNVRWEMECVFDMVRKYLPGSYVDMAMRNAKLIPLGIPSRRIDEAVRGVEKNEKFTMIFAGRWNSAKRIDKIVEVFDRVMLTDGEVEACLVTPGDIMKDCVMNLKDKFGERVRVVLKIKQEDYWREVKRSHVFVYFSPVEGYSATAREVFYLGVPQVLPRRAWVRDLLGKYYEEYPYLHDLNVNEAVFKVKMIKENYDEAMEWVRRINEEVLAEDRVEITGKRWYFYLRDLANERRKKVLETIGEGGMELIMKAYDEIEDGEVFSLSEFVELMKKFAVNKDLFGTSNTKLDIYKVYYWLEENAEDLLDGIEPRFRKKGREVGDADS